MPRNGSGQYSLPQAPFSSGTTISSAVMNSQLSDIAAALTMSVSSDGQTPMTGPLQSSAGSSAKPSLTFAADTGTGLFSEGTGTLGIAAGGTLVSQFTSRGLTTLTNVPIGVPIGAVSQYAGATAPTGWLLCYGQAISRTTYAALFAIVGTIYGSGDGSQTFNLPDCRGRVSAGVDNMGGVAAGRLSSNTMGPNAITEGAVGGIEGGTLSSGQIPQLNYSGVTTTESAGHIHNPSSGQLLVTSGSGMNGGGGGGIPIPTAGGLGGESAPHTHSYSGTVGNPSPSLVQIVQPTILFNTIIYAGA